MAEKVQRSSCYDEACDVAWAIYRNAPIREETSGLVAGIDESRPYGEVDVKRFKKARRVKVFISHLTLSQHHVSTAGLLRFAMGRKPNDVQVVAYNGRYYLHNGHHRTMYRAMLGKSWVWARVVDVDKPVAPHRWSADRA